MRDELVLSDEKTIRIFSDPLHQRMVLAMGVHGPQTSSSLARLLGGEAGRLHYHLRRLEAAGIIELDHEETINGIKARFMRPAAKSYRVAESALTETPELDDQVLRLVRQRFNLAMAEMTANVRRMGTQADGEPRERSAWLTDSVLELSVADVSALLADFAALVAKYGAVAEGYRGSGQAARDAAALREAAAGGQPEPAGLVRPQHILFAVTTVDSQEKY